MRMMLRVSVPTEQGNRAVKDNTLPKTIQKFSELAKPESSYFFVENGVRTAQFVFDMHESSQMPVLAEDLFIELNASLTWVPVMNQHELAKGLETLHKRR